MTSPVTQVALVAVKNASSGFVQIPSLDEIGRQRRSVPANIISKNPKAIYWV